MHSESHKLASKHLKRNILMDDFIMTVNTESEAIKIYHEIQDLMSRIKLPLAKSGIKEIWNQNETDFKRESMVLGVNWNTESDTFNQSIDEILLNLNGNPATKRSLLQSITKFYDPLGLFAPVLVLGKIMFQDTWFCGIQWDEILPPDIASKYNRWSTELSLLKDVKIPRWIGVSNLSNIEFHIFYDASERANGASIYMRSTTGNNITVRLVCSRLLSPVKKITLPRLELLSALTGA
ncbi:uncharacterized protein [Parasteatoda tepidariorum]|uniref:uncharacterized protein n=1 Tax=Parasteatoda tepidariorum TaxID=114398 RepID=UPI001C718A7C|nr:uncharacterized protein LOC122271789 [Parasteatoda tepidariorum]